MDDTWKAYLSSLLLSFALLGGLAGRAVELEYISPEQTKALADQFGSAQLTDQQRPLFQSKKSWSCDMYGMRTRMQVQRGVKLYDWQPGAHLAFTNRGAQPVTDYKFEKGSLLGKTEKLEDQVRFNGKGQLISRLSLAAPPGTVLAYSVCTAL